MRHNNVLRVHVLNVGHGDSILVELPDQVLYGRRPRFGLVDAGGEDANVRTKTLDYLRSFLEYRLEGPPSSSPDATDYIFEFICLTHPHSDHLHGLLPILEHYCGGAMPRALRPRQFWDCGFRYNTLGYLGVLDFLSRHPEVQFIRVTSGTEFHYDDVEIVALAPSIDMRNRYDTYGVNVNDASIVLKVTLGKGVVILTGDAGFDSWGKICEEFPRVRHLVYPHEPGGALDQRDPTADDIAFLNLENQLNCQLLKVAHHGSKRGTSYEYVEKLAPRHVVVPCDRDADYQANWRYRFPHPITRLIVAEELRLFQPNSAAIPDVAGLGAKTATTAAHGTVIYRITRGGAVTRVELGEAKADRVIVADLVNAL